MSESQPDADRTAIRTTIHDTLDAAATPPTRGDLRATVADRTAADAAAVTRELDWLERRGLVYVVGAGDGAEVKRP
jgi:hypothetical protein